MSGPHRSAVGRRTLGALAFTLLAGSLAITSGGARAVDPPPVVDSTTSVLDADVGNPDGLTSLADAVYLANTDAEADVITFDPELEILGPIDTVDVPPITEDVTIIGPGRSVLTLSSSTGDVLSVQNGADVALSDVAIDGTQSGAGPFDGLVLNDFGTALIERVDLTNVNTAMSVSQSGVDPIGSLTVVDTTVSIAEVGISTQRVADVVVDQVEVTESSLQAGVDLEAAITIDLTDVDVIDSFQGVEILDAGNVTITGLTVSDSDDRGLALQDVWGTITLDGVDVSGSAQEGIYVNAGGASPPVGETDVRNVTIIGSSISGNDRAGISVEEAGDLVLDELEVIGNGVAPASGLGGIYLGFDDTESIATISNSVIADNYGDSGGGVHVTNYTGEVTVSDSTISGNTATTGKAFRIATTLGTPFVTIERTSITGHVVGDAPVVANDDVSVIIQDSTITANSATALFTSSNGSGISMRNSTVTGNQFASTIFEAGAFSFAEANESTVTDNVLTGGSGGVFQRLTDGGQMLAVNSILSGNGVPLEAPLSLGPDPSVTYSVVPTGTPAEPTNVEADDPGVGPLVDNGGPLETMLPAEDSPAVDNGDPGGSSTGGTVDQRGLPRIVNGTIDMGAVERQESPFVIGLPPARILETRDTPDAMTVDGLFEGIGRRADGSQLELPVANRAGVPPDAVAVVINLAAVQPRDIGFVTVHPCEVNPPRASSLNFRANADVANEIVAELDENGNICLFNRANTHLLADVVGYVPAGSRYTTVGPARLLDSRASGVTVDGQFQDLGVQGSGTTIELDVVGRGGVSSTAVAAVVNVAAVKPETTGYVTVHPCLPQEPVAASLNFQPDVNRANEIVAQIDDQGRICLFVFGRAQILVDVVGQLSDENVYTAVDPARIVDSRLTSRTGTVDDLQEELGRLGVDTTLEVEVAGRAGVPDDAEVVVVNTTAIKPLLRGFLTIWDCQGTMPLASSLNYVPGEIVGNELVVALHDGKFCVFTSEDTDLTVDVVAHLG